MNTITLAKGGTGEKTIPLSELKIPNLWHISLRLKKTDHEAGQAVLDAWHITYDLKRELETTQSQRELFKCALTEIALLCESDADSTDWQEVLRLANAALAQAGQQSTD